MGHDSFIWDVTPSYAYGTFTWDMTHSYVQKNIDLLIKFKSHIAQLLLDVTRNLFGKKKWEGKKKK